MGSLTRGFLERLRSRMRSEGGFTLIELMVAIGVILVALLALAYTATIGFRDIAVARQRQSATGLANQTIEQIRALPFDVLKKGLSNGDLSSLTDPAITTSGCGAPPVYCYAGEQIPRGANPAVVPLVPHTQTITVGPTTYTVKSYVTYYNNVSSNNTFRLTVVVTWPNPGRRGLLTSVQTQTIAYSGTGCLSTGTHPFAAPCQPFLYANANADDGHLDLTGVIDGISLSKATLSMPNWTSNMQVEQISAVQGYATSSGGSITLTGNPATTSGYQQTTAQSDSDPAQPGNDYTTRTVTGSSSAVQASSGGGQANVLTVTASTGDPGSATSTTDAATIGKPCPVTGVSQNDTQPCGSSTEQQGSAGTVQLDLRKKFDLGGVSLASVGAWPASSSSAYTNRDVQMGTDGLVHAETSRSVGLVQLLGLPSGLNPAKVPSGWNGYLVSISNFTDHVTAETGTNTAAPTVTASGTLSYWNGAGYTNLSITPGTPINLAIPTIHITDTVNGSPLDILIQAGPSLDCNVWVLGCPTTGGTSSSATVSTCSPTPCPNTRTAATAKSNSPFVGDLFYKITYNGEVQAQLTLHVDLGTILAQNSYTPAPSGA